MKSTNSSFNNTQHLAFVTCTLAVLSFGVILTGIFNETHQKGVSAEASLRRRLPSRPAQAAALARPAATLEQKLADAEGEVKKLRKEKAEEEKKLQIADTKLRKENYSKWNKTHDKTIFKGESLKKTWHPWLAGGSGVIATGLWVLYSHYAGMEAGGMETQFNVPAAGCGFGILTTLALIYMMVVFSSFHGGRISTIFGETMANQTICISAGCLLFGGSSISTLAVCPPLAYVCGAFSLGAGVLVFTFFLLNLFKVKSGSAEYYGAVAVSAFTTIGAGFLFFGGNAARDAANELTTHHFTCMKISAAFFGISVGLCVLWGVARMVNEKCRQMHLDA